MIREKTSSPISVPVLLIVLGILSNYLNDDKLILPRISSQKYNLYLREIGFILGTQKNLTTLIARKNFASTVLLYNGVSMEVVSELLGHSSMNVTQESYGKVVQKKISEEMKKLLYKIE